MPGANHGVVFPWVPDWVKICIVFVFLFVFVFPCVSDCARVDLAMALTFAVALTEIALTTPGGDKWPRIVPCRLEVCGDLVCTRCCCTCSGNNEKRFTTIACLITVVYQKGMQSGSFPLWWLLNSLLVPRFRTPQPRPAIFLFLDFSLSTTWKCILYPTRASPTIITKDNTKWFPNTGCHQTKNQSLKKKLPAGEPPRSHQAGGWNMLPCPDKIKLWSSYWSLFLV